MVVTAFSREAMDQDWREKARIRRPDLFFGVVVDFGPHDEESSPVLCFIKRPSIAGSHAREKKIEIK